MFGNGEFLLSSSVDFLSFPSVSLAGEATAELDVSVDDGTDAVGAACDLGGT